MYLAPFTKQKIFMNNYYINLRLIDGICAISILISDHAVPPHCDMSSIVWRNITLSSKLFCFPSHSRWDTFKQYSITIYIFLFLYQDVEKNDVIEKNGLLQLLVR